MADYKQTPRDAKLRAEIAMQKLKDSKLEYSTKDLVTSILKTDLPPKDFVMTEIVLTKIVDMLEELSEISLNIPHDGQRSLNKTLLAKYRTDLSPTAAQLLDRIVDCTKYVSFSSLLQSMDDSLKKFEEGIGDRPFYLYLPTSVKSTLLFAGHFWPRIRALNCVGVVCDRTAVESGMQVLIIDDGIYTGWSLLNISDEMTYCESSGKNHLVTFHFVVGHCSRHFADCEMPNFTRNSGHDIHLYCCQDFVEKIEWTEKEAKIVEQELDCDTLMPVPLYFDHKIAGKGSSYPSIYGRLLDDQCMTTYNSFDIKDLIRNNVVVQEYVAQFTNN